jgi:hypothetical protein
LLDTCIDRIWEIFKKNSTKFVPRSSAGINGEQWHIEVIRLAMKLYDPKHYLLKVKVVGGGCLDLVNNLSTDGRTGEKASFFVDGHLGKTFMRVGRNFKRTGELHQQDGFDDPEKKQDQTWRHAIAVKGDRMFCAGLPENGVTLSNLWLDHNGKPRSGGYGYMKRILRVYQVMDSDEGFLPEHERTEEYIPIPRKHQRVK